MSKVGSMFNGFFAHWSKPGKGKYISSKEAAAYCVGGMGAVGATIFISYVTLTAGIYIAVALGISVRDIWLIGVINSIVAIASRPLMSLLVDNTRSKMGKFRPYLIWLSIPMVLLYVAIGNIPFLFTEYTGRLVSYTIIFVILNIVNQMYTNSYNGLINVITPNTQERDNLMSVGAFLYSLGPSISQLIFPLFAEIFYGSAAVNQPDVYRIVVPVFVAIFVSIGLLAGLFTKERVIVSKTYQARVKFFDGLKKVAQNKYFWINNISGIFGILRLLATTLNAWICIYILNSSATIGLIATIMGTASIPGMLLAPMLIRKFGKKKVTIFVYIMGILLPIPMLFLMSQPIVLFVFVYLIFLFNGVTVVSAALINADVYDYQQWKTGDRLEGFMGNMGNMIYVASTIGTSAVMPFIYEYLGFVDNADVLYDSAVRDPIFMWTFIVGMICGVCTLIPFLFYDLTEKKHEEIIEELKQRAEEENRALELAEGGNAVEAQ